VAGPLEGVRVLELAQGTAGPYAGRLFAGLGADVVKVEPPGTGDVSRARGPFAGGREHRETSIPHLYLNAAKRSATLDLTAAEAPSLVRELAGSAHVVLEDLPAADRGRLALSYESLAGARPSIVVASVTHFGLSGRLAGHRGAEVVDQALSGHMAITGEAERGPLQIGGDLAQYVAGQTAFTGALFALYHALGTGEGQQVDCSVVESFADILDGEAILALNGMPRPRLGNHTADGFLRGRGGLYECADGWVALGQTPGGWEAFAEAVGDERLLDPALATPGGRAARKAEVESIVEQWVARHTKLEIYLGSQTRRNVCGFVATPADLLASEHLRAREYFVSVEHPVAGRAESPGAPFRFAGAPWVAGRAPLLGEHNRAVYVELLGMAPAELERLQSAGVM